jgi:hypothetical protein
MNTIAVKSIVSLFFIIVFSFSQDSTMQIPFQTYINNGQKYKISYPKTWYFKTIDISEHRKAYISIENLKQRVIISAPVDEPTQNGSSFQIHASSDSSAKDIEEKIKNYEKTGRLNETAINGRLKDVVLMKIGDQNLKAWYRKGDRSCALDFIYNHKYFYIYYGSGSEDQYAQDSLILNKMFSSFTLLK